MKTKRNASWMITVSLLLLSGCQRTPTEAVTEAQNAGLPNPASVFCEDQGGTLEIRTDADGGQYGICIFDDGSECDEWAYFRGECQPGDSLETLPADEGAGAKSEADDVVVARQAIVEYLVQHYDIEISGEWQNFESGPDDSPTRRFVSDSWMIALTPVETAVEPPTYEVEIGNITGFNWQGTIDANGEIQEIAYIPPATILSADEARDAVVVFLVENYNLTAPGVWAVERPEPKEPGIVFVIFTADAWTVEVSFMPAAPIVSKYNLVIDNTSASLHWEGEITSRGEITEIQATQY
jgi:putative hemolysin